MKHAPVRIFLLALASAALSGAGCAPSSSPGATAVSAASAALPFIEDDYAQALARAKSEGRPLFVDAWAPWCHTCLSMRAYVFTDPALRARAGDFVWLALDTEKPSSAPFLEAFPMEVWPTLWVIDARTEKPALKWLGSATPAEMVDLLDDAKAAVQHGDTGAEAAAAAAWARGNRASAEGKREDAVREYRSALTLAAPAWPRRSRVVEALAARLAELHQWDACVELAKTEMPRLAPGTSLANVALTGLECAEKAPEGEPAHAEVGALAAAAERLAVDRSLPILADDRSGLFEALVDHYKDSGKPTDAKVLALKWADFLDAEAARARDAASRSVFDAHRMLACIALGEPERALPMLASSEREFPSDYNPPARIARVYLELKRYDEALAAANRALGRGYGPRKVRLYTLKADVLRGKGDAAALVATLREAVAYTKSLPPAEVPPRMTADLEKRLADASR
jgi:tetratricopeptide (TPR) repeat protein